MPTRFTIESVGATEILVRNNARAVRLLDLQPELDAAADEVYAATTEWYESDGEGSWPELAASTVERKISSGYAEPDRILYAVGNLFESATGPSGPYSWRIHGENAVGFGVDWDEGGWQIAVVHHYGTDSAGAGHNVHIPARPIWPSHDSMIYLTMREKIRALMFHGL